MGVLSHAGAVPLVDAIGAGVQDRALSVALEPWRRPTAVHDPAKILLDVAVSLALGGDCLGDIAVLRGSSLSPSITVRGEALHAVLDDLAAAQQLRPGPAAPAPPQRTVGRGHPRRARPSAPNART